MIRELFLSDLSLWGCFWQSTILVAAGLVGSFILRNRSARAHQVLILSMIAAVCVPVASVLVRHLEMGVFVAEPVVIQSPAEESIPANVQTTPVTIPSEDFEPMPTLMGAYSAPVAADSKRAGLPWRSVVLCGWIAASLILAARLSLTFVLGVRLLGRAVRLDCEKIERALCLAKARLGIDKGVRVYGSRGVRSPVIWCWRRRPVLLVPSAAGHPGNRVDWTGVLCHELAHCKRRDHISGLLAELIVCILPWHPLLWWAKSRLRDLSEQACDDWVVAAGQPGTDYAESLLDLTPQAQMAFAPAVVSSRNRLAGRIRRILKESCGNPRAGLVWVLAVSVTTVCIGLGVALAQTRPAKTNTIDKGDQENAKSLHEAAADGDIKTVESLISAGADVNTIDELKYTPLHHAAENGHADLAKFLIVKGADLEARNHYGRTPLALAACRGHKQMVELLIAQGADFDTKDIWYKRLLHHAAVNGHAELAGFLIDRGADIESETNLDYTPLSLAASKGHTQMVGLLIAKGAAVDPKEQMKYTPLHHAASGGHYEIAKLLVAAGADVDAEDLSRQTPLYEAVMAGHRQIAELLVKKGATISFPALHFAAFMGDLPEVKRLIEGGVAVDSGDKYGQTPLFFAARVGDRKVVEFLLDNGANIGSRTDADKTVLHYAARYGRKDMAELLISKGAEVNVIALTGAANNTPLDHAVLSGHADVAAVLLDHGADPDIKGYCNVMPLHRAAQSGRMDVAELLLAHGAAVNVKGGSIEITPLHWAAGPDHAEVAELLIANGADVNAKDKNGATPLNYAAGGKGSKVAKILIEKGADINARDNRGRTPLDRASGKGNSQAVELLIAAGAQVGAKADNGRTALSPAKLNEVKEVVEPSGTEQDKSGGTQPQKVTVGRTLHFPTDRSLGTLYIRDAEFVRKLTYWFHWTGTGEPEWEHLSEAKGDVPVPAGKQLRLVVNQTGSRDLSPLAKLRPDDLYELGITVLLADPAKPSDDCMPYIAHLTGLKSLRLDRTNVTDRGFEYIRNLTSLEYLHMPMRVTDRGMAYVARLRSLKGLYFGEMGSWVTDAGLRHLAKLNSLEELALLGERMGDYGLAHLRGLPRLKYLFLYGTHFTDKGCVYLKDIPSLKILSFYEGRCPIRNAGLADVAKIATLESLSLNVPGPITDDGIAYLSKMRSLKKLDIASSRITDRGLAYLSRVKTLETLSLPQDQKGITDKGLMYIGRLPNLKSLGISRIHFSDPSMNKEYYTDKGLAELVNCRLLEDLSVGSIGITDAGMDHIAKLTNLKKLLLFGCDNLTDEGLAKLAPLKSLRTLNVPHSNVTFAGLAQLKSLPDLTKLDVGNLQRGGSALDLSGLTNLQELGLNFKHYSEDTFGDADLACLAQLKKLRWLQIGPRNFTDKGISHLAGLTNMERLGIGGAGLTDETLKCLANMKKLDHLSILGGFDANKMDFSSGGRFTDVGLQHLEGLTRLRFLQIYCDNTFGAAALQRLQTQLPDLFYLRINGRDALTRAEPPQQRTPATRQPRRPAPVGPGTRRPAGRR